MLALVKVMYMSFIASELSQYRVYMHANKGLRCRLANKSIAQLDDIDSVPALVHRMMRHNSPRMRE